MGNKSRGYQRRQGIRRLLFAAVLAFGMAAAARPAVLQASQSGWITKGSDTYYYEPSTGQKVCRQWKLISGQYYYFDGSGKLIRNKWVGNYHVGDSGALDRNKWIGKYFVGEDGKWIKNFKGG